MTVTLEFPAPTRPLSENEKRKMSHWGQWRRRLDPWFEATQWAWKMLSHEDREKTREAAIRSGIDVLVELPFQKRARRDPHNYVGTNVKTIVDALTTKMDQKYGQILWAGAWTDDTPEFVTVFEPQIVIGTDLVKVHLTERGNSSG